MNPVTRSVADLSAVLTLLVGGGRDTPRATGPAPCVPSRWVLLYSGGLHRPAYTVADLVRYVAVVDTTGTPTAWLTTGAIVLEFQAPSTHTLSVSSSTRSPALGSDWTEYLDSIFAPHGVLARFDSAVGVVEAKLGARRRPYDVAISIPYPNPDSKVLHFNNRDFDFGTTAGRVAAAGAYVGEVAARFKAAQFRYLGLDGYYWLVEMVPVTDTSVVRGVADVIHQQGRRLLWIPDYRDQGIFTWWRFGVDQVWMQPNYFVKPEVGIGRMDSAVVFVRLHRLGFVVEFDRRMFNEPTRFGGRLDPYLYALDSAPDLRAGPMALYEGGGGLVPFSGGRDSATRARYQHFTRVFGVPATAGDCR